MSPARRSTPHLASLALLLAACGGGDDDGASADAGNGADAAGATVDSGPQPDVSHRRGRRAVVALDCRVLRRLSQEARIGGAPGSEYDYIVGQRDG